MADPLTDELMEKVRRIEIRARHIVRQQTAGAWQASFKGQGIEFSEVREFQEGDEVRAVDWNISARMGRPYIKLFTEEREQNVFLLVDASASGHLASTEVTKAERLAEIAAVLALSATLNKDRVGLMLFTDQEELHLAPSRSRHHVLRMIREVLAFESASPRTDLGAAIERLLTTTRRRGVVFILSDLLDTEYEQPLRMLAQRHDVAVLHQTDPLEREWPNLPFGCSVQLQGLETGRQVRLTPRRSRKLADRSATQREAAQSLIRRAGADYVALDTAEDYLPALFQFFQQRIRRRS